MSKDDAVLKYVYGPQLGVGFTNNPADNRQTELERMYVRILSEMCVNRFKWEGMPKEINLRFLETVLMRDARILFYYDSNMSKYLTMRAAFQGNLDYYDEPTSFTPIGTNYRHTTMSADECVPIYSNYFRVPDTDIIRIYASKLATTDMTIEINLMNARRTRVLAVGENNRLSYENIDKQLLEGKQTIQVDTSLEGMNVQALDLGMHPDHIEKIHIVKARLWSECMTYLGIDNANQDKKERLVASEVDANNSQVTATRFVNLNARRLACEVINERYPELNVTVKYHLDDVDTVENEESVAAATVTEPEEVTNDAVIHD